MRAQGNTVAVKMLTVKDMSAAARVELRSEALAMFEKPHPCVATIYGEDACASHTKRTYMQTCIQPRINTCLAS